MNYAFRLAAFVLLATATCGNAQTTRAELIDDIVGKYFDVYSRQPDRTGEFSIGSSYTDRFREDGLVRIVISLPDGTQKSLDFDDRFGATKPAKIEPTSKTTSRLSFVFSSSAVSVTSTVQLSAYRPIAYQVWTIDTP